MSDLQPALFSMIQEMNTQLRSVCSKHCLAASSASQKDPLFSGSPAHLAPKKTSMCYSFRVHVFLALVNSTLHCSSGGYSYAMFSRKESSISKKVPLAHLPTAEGSSSAWVLPAINEANKTNLWLPSPFRKLNIGQKSCRQVCHAQVSLKVIAGQKHLMTSSGQAPK